MSRAFALAVFLAGAPAIAAASEATETSLAEALAEGDRHYQARGEAAAGAESAPPAEIEAAMGAYRRALGLAPGSNEARYKLLRALFFRSTFCPLDRAKRDDLFDEARRVADEGVTRLEPKAVQGEARLAILRQQPEVAAPVFFWAAVWWGERALVKGKLTAAREGAAARIRDLAETVIALDPALEQGGGYRVLGRLHDQAPRIPLLTGWVSHPRSVTLLEKALALGPDNTVNEVFLAEAILDHDPAQRARARTLLAHCADARPRPEYLVEDAHYIARARLLLTTVR